MKMSTISFTTGVINILHTEGGEHYLLCSQISYGIFGCCYNKEWVLFRHKFNLNFKTLATLQGYKDLPYKIGSGNSQVVSLKELLTKCNTWALLDRNNELVLDRLSMLSSLTQHQERCFVDSMSRIKPTH